ncbi:MAG: 30S ribosomal protein S6 [Candidatus Levybacteria bacterium]|nr:30S ribosomal protein S6 [Candidatus Levybacteria bacterium]
MIYQLTLVINSALKEADQKKLLEGIKSGFGKAKIEEKSWGQKALSYPIKKEVSGAFFHWNIETEEVIDKGFETKLINNDKVLRHLLLRLK